MIYSPKDSYKCKSYSYSPDNGSNVFIQHLSEGIGMVKFERYNYKKRFTSKTLIDCKLNK